MELAGSIGSVEENGAGTAEVSAYQGALAGSLC